MQISGEKSFVAGSKELIAFKDIRRSVLLTTSVSNYTAAVAETIILLL